MSNHLWEIVDQAEVLRSQLTSAITRDAEAYQEYLRVISKSKESGLQNDVTSATAKTIQVPLEMAQQVVSVLEIIARTAAICHPAVLGDLGSAVALARSALSGAGINIRANAKLITDDVQLAESFLISIRNLEERFVELDKQIKSILQERGDLTLPEIL